MAEYSVSTLSKRSFYSVREENVIGAILSLDTKAYFCTVDGKIINDFHLQYQQLPSDAIFQLHFRLLGGKGGFGSLLRSFRVNKSTNQLMCRDLNGRRLASIDEEQKLRKWIERTAEREREKIAKRKAKYEKLKSGPPRHMFNDPDYIRQKETIIENTEEAFEQGFVEFLKEEQEKKINPPAESSSDSDFDVDDLPGSLRTTRKRKAHKTPSVVAEKVQKVEDGDDEDSDTDENDFDLELLHEITDYFSAKDSKANTLGTEKPCSSHIVEKHKEENETLPVQDSMSLLLQNTLQEVDPESTSREVEEFAEVDLEQFESAAQLETLGLQHLKHALLARGMKCGGTLSERAARLFSAKKVVK